MRSVVSGLALILVAGIACRAKLLAPSSQTIAGRWSRAPQPQAPSGQYYRMLEFTDDGHYVLTGAFRGIYPQLPADSVGSISREYGTYVLDRNTLRFTQDSRTYRSEEYTSELQSRLHLVCRLLLEKKKRALDLIASPVSQPHEADRRPSAVPLL